LPQEAKAGDEDVKQPKKAVEQKTPEDTALPKEAEAPEASIGAEEEKTPDFEEAQPKKPSPKAAKARKRFDPDENVDYSKIIDLVEAADPPDGVLPPALGFRGYMPNMVALGAGDRTPGFGLLLEYSWNRIGFGLFASRLNAGGDDRSADAKGFGGLYGMYRWLPFDFSPYIHLGLEFGSQTQDTFGGLTGAGVEARIYRGVTLLVGWTYHSVDHQGYLGGALGWSF
jgi:hypothetical protein